MLGETPSIAQSTIIGGGEGPQNSMFTVSVQPDLTMYSTRAGMGQWRGPAGGGAKWKTKEEEEKIDPRSPNDHPVLKVSLNQPSHKYREAPL